MIQDSSSRQTCKRECIRCDNKLVTDLVLRPTPDRTKWASRGINVFNDSASTTFMHESKVSHIGEPLAMEILKLSSFSDCIPTFAAWS